MEKNEKTKPDQICEFTPGKFGFSKTEAKRILMCFYCGLPVPHFRDITAEKVYGFTSKCQFCQDEDEKELEHHLSHVRE